MRNTVVIVGAGQAGLAMSACLQEKSVDHVLLERGKVANSWRNERWDSLRLLTPNWLSRLPGLSYQGCDPDGYMTGGEVVAFLTDYQATIAAPVYEGITVTKVQRSIEGYRVSTDHGEWRCDALVIATGACGTQHLPRFAADVPSSINQLTSLNYRRPEQLPDGQVLVVGASASGVQIADELQRSGRQVMLAVGEHVRVPRRYRGRDIHWWLDALGVLDERYDSVDDLGRARRTPSFQLIGSPQRRSLDLNVLSSIGVRLVGRLAAVVDGRAQLSGSMANACASADLKQARLLDRIDTYMRDNGLDADPADRPEPTVLPSPINALDLNNRLIRTIVWATGFRPEYPWLEPALLDRSGTLRHDGGVMPSPGMYVLGLPFTRRRKSSFLDGVGPDARELAAHLVDFLGRRGAGVSERGRHRVPQMVA